MSPKIIDIFILVGIALLFSGSYLFSGVPEEYWGDAVGGAAHTVFISDAILNWHEIFPNWFSYGSIPMWNIVPSPFIYLNVFLYLLANDIWLVVKIVQVIQFIVCGISMYLFANSLFRERPIALSSALIYTMTPFYFSQLAHHVFLAWAYALLPIGFLALFRLNRAKNYRNALLAAAAIGAIFLSSIQAVYTAGIALLVFIFGLTASDIFHVLKEFSNRITGTKRDLKMKFKTIGPILILPIVIFLLISFLYIPSLAEPFPYFPMLERFSIENIITIRSTVELLSLQYTQVMPFLSEPIPPTISALSLFTLATASASLLWKDKRKLVLVLFLVGILSMLLSMGPNSFFSIFYNVLHEILPGFHSIRTTDRFLIGACLSFSILAGVTVGSLVKKINFFFRLNERRIKHFFTIALIIIMLSSVLYVGYYQSHEQYFLGPFRSTPLPSAYSQVQEWLEENNKANYRVFDLTHGSGAEPLHSLGQKSFLWNYDDLVLRFYKTNYFAKLLALLNIKYILISSNTTPFNDNLDIYNTLKDSPDFIIHELGVSEPNIYDILDQNEVRTSKLVIFENKQTYPLTYPARGILIFGGPNALSFLNFNNNESDLKVGWAPIFIAQDANVEKWMYLTEYCENFLFQNSDPMDLFIYLCGDYIQAYQYANNDDWELAQSYYSSNVPRIDHSFGSSVAGQLLLSDYAIFTDEADTSFDVNFDANSSDYYDVMLRSYSPKVMSIALYLDDKFVQKVELEGGFKWSKLYTGFISNGFHKLTIITEDDNAFYLDAISVASKSNFERNFEEFNSNFAKYEIPIAYLLDYKYFSESSPLTNSISNCESITDWGIWGNGTISSNADKKIEGQKSLEWNYTAGDFQFLAFVPDLPQSIDSSATLRLSIFGDMSNNTLIFKIFHTSDSYSVHTQKIDFQGWRQIEIPMYNKDIMQSEIISIHFIMDNGFGTLWLDEFEIIPMSYPSNPDSMALGNFLILLTNAKLTSDFYVNRKGNYTISVRYSRDSEGSLMIETNKDTSLTIQDASPTQGFTEKKLQIQLNSGRNQIVISNLGPSPLSFDSVYIREDNSVEKINDGLQFFETTQTGTAMISGSIQISEPRFIVLTETYFPGWQIKLNGERIEPLVAFTFLNAFLIEDSKSFEISFEDTEVRLLTKLVSGLTIFVAIFSFSVLFARRIIVRTKLKLSKRQQEQR